MSQKNIKQDKKASKRNSLIAKHQNSPKMDTFQTKREFVSNNCPINSSLTNTDQTNQPKEQAPSLAKLEAQQQAVFLENQSPFNPPNLLAFRFFEVTQEKKWSQLNCTQLNTRNSKRLVYCPRKGTVVPHFVCNYCKAIFSKSAAYGGHLSKCSMKPIALRADTIPEAVDRSNQKSLNDLANVPPFFGRKNLPNADQKVAKLSVYKPYYDNNIIGNCNDYNADEAPSCNSRKHQSIAVCPSPVDGGFLSQDNSSNGVSQGIN